MGSSCCVKTCQAKHREFSNSLRVREWLFSFPSSKTLENKIAKLQTQANQPTQKWIQQQQKNLPRHLPLPQYCPLQFSHGKKTQTKYTCIKSHIVRKHTSKRHYQHCSCQSCLAIEKFISVPNSHAHGKLSWDMIPCCSTFHKGEEWQQVDNSWKLPCQKEVPYILWATWARGFFLSVRNAHSLAQINSFSSELNPHQHHSFALSHLVEATLSTSAEFQGWTEDGHRNCCVWKPSNSTQQDLREMWGTEKLLGF